MYLEIYYNFRQRLYGKLNSVNRCEYQILQGLNCAAKCIISYSFSVFIDSTKGS